MMNVVLALHLMVAVALVGMVLMQRSEGGALGMGGGGSLMSGRGAANALARGTSILGAVFFFTSITLTILAGGARAPKSVVDTPVSSPLAPITEFISGLTKPAPKPSVIPAPVVPVSPALAPVTAPPATTGEVVPAPDAAVQRAAPLEGAATAPLAAPATTAAPKPAVAPAVTAAPRTAPATSAIPRPAPLVRATPSVQVPASTALTSVKPAESSEPQTPADRPRGRAGPDE